MCVQVCANEGWAGGQLQAGGRLGSIRPVLWLFSHGRRHTLTDTDRYKQTRTQTHTHTHTQTQWRKMAKPLALELSP